MWYGEVEGPASSRSIRDSTPVSRGTCGSSGCGPGRAGREGPAWFAAGRYLIWSDIPNNRMMRLTDPGDQVSVFREHSNNSNGNTVDNQGRLVTCEHLTRRVTRTEYDGSISVLADKWEGKRFNSPNDVVVKSDNSIWFTDPAYGIDADYEGDRRSRRSTAATSTASIRRAARSTAGHQQHGAAERHRLLARREIPLRRRHRRDA